MFSAGPGSGDSGSAAAFFRTAQKPLNGLVGLRRIHIPAGRIHPSQIGHRSSVDRDKNLPGRGIPGQYAIDNRQWRIDITQHNYSRFEPYL